MKKTAGNGKYDNNAGLTLIVIMVVFAPLARGGVNPWAVSVIQCGILLAAAILLVKSITNGESLIPETPLTLPIAALLILAAVSAAFSSHPVFAVEGMLLLVTYAAVYFSVQFAVRTRKQQLVVIYALIGTALFLAVFGLFKRFGLNPFPFWQYEELRYSPTFLASTYGNHNHLAGFIEMVLPFLLILFLTRSRHVNMILVLLYLVLILLVVQALTLSRGGWIATICSIFFMTGTLLFQRRFKSKKLILVLSVATVAVSGFILASTPIVERVMTLTEQDASATMEGRIRAWSGTIDMIRDNFATGTGPGTYAAAFPEYQPPGLGATYKQAHNDYLQFTSDLGLLVIPIMLWIIFLVFKTGFSRMDHQSRQVRGISLAVMTAFFAIAIHSIGDFNLHIPANALALTVIAGLLK